MGAAWMLATAVLFCLLAVFAYHLFASVLYANKLVELLSNGGHGKQVADALAVFGVPLAALYALSRRRDAFPHFWFIGAYLLAASALCAGYVSRVSPNYVSDFQRMWDAASQLASGGLHPVNGIIQQRALPVLYPVIKLFGPHPLAIEIANAAMFAAIGLFGYDALRLGQGHRMAQAFCLVWLCSFEPVMAIAIPTHDLWGLFFIAAAIWAIARVFSAFSGTRVGVRLLGWTALAGLLLELVQLQREVGLILLLACVLSMVFLAVWYRRDGRFIALPAVTLVAAYALSGALLGWGGARAPAQGEQDLNTARLAGFSASFSDGRFPFGMAMRKTFLDPVPRPEAQALAHSIFLSDIVEQPEGRVANVVKRMSSLAQPGSQIYFYAAGVPKPRIQAIQVFDLLSALIVFGLGTLAVARLLHPSRRWLRPTTATMVLFSGGMLAIFCMVSELQPRYAFFMWFTSAMLVAEGFFADARRVEGAAHGQ
jgi:hypothetical protein